MEVINKIIKKNIKSNLDEHKEVWVDELPKVLGAYRTTIKTSTGKTPFSLAFGVEAVVLIKVRISSYKIDQFQPKYNEA